MPYTLSGNDIRIGEVMIVHAFNPCPVESVTYTTTVVRKTSRTFETADGNIFDLGRWETTFYRRSSKKDQYTSVTCTYLA